MRLLVLCLALSGAVPARAAFSQPAALDRISSVFSTAGSDVMGAWHFGGVPATPLPPVTYRTLAAPLISKALWDASPAPSAAALAWLQQRIPGLNGPSVHEISYDSVANVIGEAARRGDSTLDIFTDEGLRGNEAFYLSEATLHRLYAEFDLQTSLLQSGTTTEGDAFRMDGIVMGRNSLQVLYNIGPFDFKNPGDGNKYTVDSRVTQTIEGAGQLAISGMWVHAWPVTARIQKLVKLGPGRLRVETNYGNRERNDPAVRRR